MADENVTIVDERGLKDVLKVFSALDDIRWKHTDNYNLINFARADLADDEQLLTHWLCYITDQMTPFARVWDVAGYILSQLVRDFAQHVPISTIVTRYYSFADPPQKKRSNSDTEGSTPAKRKFFLLGQLPAFHRRLHFYQIEPGPVTFSSVCMPSNAFAIYRTLVLLDRFSSRSFAKFLMLCTEGISDRSTAVHRAAIALHSLTYDNLGQLNVTELEKRLSQDSVKGIPEESFEVFLSRLQSTTDKFDPFGKKRLWCSLRDYLKSQHFNGCLVRAIREYAPAEAEKWDCNNPEVKKALEIIELPGDTWNNKPIFREGLFDPTAVPTLS